MSKSFPDIMRSEFLKIRELSGLTSQEAAEICSVSLRTMYRWENNEIKPKPLAVKHLKAIAELANKPINKVSHSFTYIDLFAGIGGFRKAFDRINGKCVFTSEWDKSCRTTYMANNICDHEVVGDIREFTLDEDSLSRIPKHDVLVAGFPCQPFSIAGVSKKNSLGRLHGFRCETQGTLFFDLAQIIDYHRPSAFLLENVKNLVSHDKGNTFRVIKKTLEEELGYKISCRVIDGQYWVPQHRERILIAGFKKDSGFSFNNFELPSFSEKPLLKSILHHEDGSEMDDSPYYENGKVNEKYTLTPRLWEYLQEYKERQAAKGNGFGFGLVGPDDIARTLSARYYKDGSEILIQQSGKRPRRLTPRECARLMGFDKPGEANFVIPVSDTQAYHQFGNSVIVPMAEAVAKFMKPHILKNISFDEKQIEIPFEQELVSI